MISLITVCFNGERHIAHALASVERQEGAAFEHLIIDGASTDRTLTLVQERPQPWRRVYSEPDRGIYDAMNKGIRLSTGDIVGFLNADDFYVGPHVLRTVERTMADPTVDACYGDVCYVRAESPSEVVRYWRSSPFTPGMFGRGWCPPHPTFFVRRWVYERYGLFDQQYRIASDVELMARFLEVHRIRSRYVPEVLVHMRLGGVTNRSWSNIWTQNGEVWRALQSHGLRPSLPSFVTRKVLSRAKQFIVRPR